MKNDRIRKILIVIADMEIGGAQKSLLSFLQCLAESEHIGRYEIHLLPVKPTGAFLKQVPAGIRIVQPDRALCWLGMRLNRQLLEKYFCFRGLVGELMWIVRKKLGLLPGKLNLEQKTWSNWRRFIRSNPEHYDAAVSYMDGVSHYYVAEKVQADKKVSWVHNEYQKQGYDPAFDRPYLDRTDALITISEKCRDCLRIPFPDFGEKIHVIENITQASGVLRLSRSGSCPEYAGMQKLRLLSVGRLHPQKGMDLAVEAARLLKAAGVDFIWLVLGDGPERARLQAMIDAYGLGACFCLAGSKENPYAYMRECDILVQSSRTEGKSIVLDEAKLLCKPIVVTRYATVRDAIEHGENGWIVDMEPKAICRGVERLWRDAQLRQSLAARLESASAGNEAELKRYIEVMF